MKKIRLLSIFLSLYLLQLIHGAELKIPVLMYHHIRASQSAEMKMLRDLSVSPEIFLQHLNYIKQHGYKTITFEDLYYHFQLGEPLPPKPLVLTFDDGYADNWQAFLELKKRKMRGVFFIITNQIGTPEHLSAEQIKVMSSSGMEIGSHTKDHYPLTITKRTRQAQIIESKKVLEELLGKTVHSFCYPSGQLNKEILSIVEEAGYVFARTTRRGISSFTGNNYLIKTIAIYNNTSYKKLEKYLP